MILPNNLGPYDRLGGSPDETAAYLQRVIADAGTVADTARLVTAVNQQKIPNTMGANKYDSASFVLSANGGYKAGKLYALKPATGSADPVHGRNSVAQRRNAAQQYVQEAIDVPLFHFRTLNGPPVIRFEPSITPLLLNSTLAGGTTPPTGWSRSNNGGTPTSLASLFGNAGGAVAYRMAATSNQESIESANISFVAGTTYTLSVLVEAVTGTVQLNNFMRLAGTVIGTLSYRVNGVIVAGTSNLTTGFLEILFECTGNSSNTLRIGAGTGLGPVTATVTISRPQVEIGRYRTSWVPTTNVTATRAVSQFSAGALQAASVFAANEGCFLLDLNRMLTNAAGTAVIVLRRADLVDIFRIEANAVANQYRVVVPTLGLTTTYNAGTKIAIAWNGTNVRVSQGGAIVGAINGAVGAIDHLRYAGAGLLDANEMLGYFAAPTDSNLNALTV